MDVFAHTLWTNVVFHAKYHNQRKMRYLAAFFGVVPDLIGFAPMFIYLFFTGWLFKGFPNIVAAINAGEISSWTFGFAQQAYNFTHSLVIFAVVFLTVAAIGMIYKYRQNRQWRWWGFWPLLGWALHILIDIPTHPEFYHTPFLFPLSEVRNTHGVSWAHPTFMLINYSALVLAYVLLVWSQRRQRAQS